MKIENLSPSAQDGLRAWGLSQHDDELMFDGIGGNLQEWAWIWFQLRQVEDKEEWFPKGKWATLQRIEELLDEEAGQVLREKK